MKYKLKRFLNELKYDVIFGVIQGYLSVALCWGVLVAFVAGLMKAGVVLG